MTVASIPRQTKPLLSLLPCRARSPWHPIDRRRFRAAMLVLLGQHVFEELSNVEKARVDCMADEINRDAHNDYPYLVRQRKVDPSASDDWRFVWRARAMGALGIPTGIVGLNWKELFSGRRNPVFDFLAFRRFHRATDDAIAFLHENA